MSYKVTASRAVEKVLKTWKKSAPIHLKKFQQIVLELQEHPRTGTGHPEPLVGGMGITYSRRLSAMHRIVYDIYEEEVTVYIIDIKGHYDDK